MMGGGSWFGGLLMLLFLGLLVALIVVLVMWAIRASHGHGSHGKTADTGSQPLPSGAAGHDEAVAIAKRRLASGEITPEQYAEIMRALGT